MEDSSHQKNYRQCLSMVVAAMCVESGYDTAEEAVVETLTEILQSYLSEVGSTTRLFCEHSGRTLPNGRDVMCAFADVGFSSKHLSRYIRRPGQINLGQINFTPETLNPAVLQVGKRKNFPLYVPDGYNFPSLPDPHAYIRTTTGQKSASDYVILRERLSEQRRDVERALTRFVAKTGKSHPLLPHDRNAFPLIAAEPTPFPYLSALLPSEHEVLTIADNNKKETSSDDSTPSKDRKSKKRGSGDDDSIVSSQEQAIHPHRPDIEQSSVIRNPYLRPVKKPKLKKKF